LDDIDIKVDRNILEFEFFNGNNDSLSKQCKALLGHLYGAIDPSEEYAIHDLAREILILMGYPCSQSSRIC
jgi:hypothetical protein